MRRTVLLLSSLLLFAFVDNSDCDRLADGKYIVEFSDENYENFELTIQTENYIRLNESGDTVCGKFIWSDCLFILENLKEQKMLDSLDKIGKLTELDKLLKNSFGKYCFEIVHQNSDTAYFRTTYTGNLHVTVATGRLLRISNYINAT